MPEFIAGRWRYRREADGYLLYSVGHNGQGDDGRFEDDHPACDDVAIKMPVPPVKNQ